MICPKCVHLTRKWCDCYDFAIVHRPRLCVRFLGIPAAALPTHPERKMKEKWAYSINASDVTPQVVISPDLASILSSLTIGPAGSHFSSSALKETCWRSAPAGSGQIRA